MNILIYIIPAILCFIIAAVIWKDRQNWDNYLAGGSMEMIISILIGLLPIANIAFSFLVGGKYIIEKLKRKYDNRN